MPSSSSEVHIATREILLQRGTAQGETDETTYQLNEDATRAMQALNVLQFSHDGKTTSDCIDIAMQFHLHYLRKDASLWYTTHQYPQLNNLFQGMQDKDEGQQAFTAANALLDTEPRFFHQIKSHTLTLWPITVNQHWIALILHILSDPNPTTTTTTIAAAAIADPERNPTTTAFLWRRLQAILTPARGFRFAHPQPQPLAYPRQTDGFSCGLRVYEILRTMVYRANDELEQGGGGGGALWADIGGGGGGGEFQTDRVRAEMIGVVGVEALRAVGWKGRLVVAPCRDGVQDGEREGQGQGVPKSEKTVLDFEMVDVETWMNFREHSDQILTTNSQPSTGFSSSFSSATGSSASDVSFIAARKRKEAVKGAFANS